jgi:hypothetical protein
MQVRGGGEQTAEGRVVLHDPPRTCTAATVEPAHRRGRRGDVDSAQLAFLQQEGEEVRRWSKTHGRAQTRTCHATDAEPPSHSARLHVGGQRPAPPPWTHKSTGTQVEEVRKNSPYSQLRGTARTCTPAFDGVSGPPPAKAFLQQDRHE